MGDLFRFCCLREKEGKEVIPAARDRREHFCSLEDILNLHLLFTPVHENDPNVPQLPDGGFAKSPVHPN